MTDTKAKTDNTNHEAWFLRLYPKKYAIIEVTRGHKNPLVPTKARQGGYMSIIANNKEKSTRQKCQIEGCLTLYYKSGFCKHHYTNNKHTGDPLKQRTCTIDGCERLYMGRGYCRNHYEAIITKRDRPNYNTWVRMKMRCYNENYHLFHRYGGRGIKVCDEWRHDYFAFERDMGAKPTAKHSLDRIDNNGDYTPENCRWAESVEQSVNREIIKNKNSLAGVSWSNRRKKWEATISKDGKKHWLGTYAVMDDAVSARLDAEIKYYGRQIQHATK